MNEDLSIEKMAQESKQASFEMARGTTNQKNAALQYIIDGLQAQKDTILKANLEDVQQAKRAGLNEAMIDRLSIQNQLEGICSDIQRIIQLPDPIGECFEEPNHAFLKMKKCRTSIGVLGIIYESRPNVTIDCSVLAIKSGNCAILRGGSETIHTNRVLVHIIQEALKKAQLPHFAIQLVASTDRIEVQKMLRMYEYIDLIIPRGGANLHRFCRENSSIPVITGGVGICHLFVDPSANLEKSLEVIFNAKVQRPTVCNALDTLLISETLASDFVPQVMNKLAAKNVHFRLDARSFEIAQQQEGTFCYKLAKEEDWGTEWLSLVLGIKVVKDLDEAILHIAQHSTGHSEGILTENKYNADRFVAEVDSAAVYVNASTRFTDGGQFGLGAEVAISTQKLHARGPMGLKELTSYKWVISGDYAVRP